MEQSIILQAAALIASLASAIVALVAVRFFNVKIDEKHTRQFTEGVYNAVMWLVGRYGSPQKALDHVEQGAEYVKSGKPDAFSYFKRKGEEPEALAYNRIESTLKSMAKKEVE